ncbi:MAG: RagB/SusD family nutrient uptake outer membrane protein, partial [Tannerella sp.]|nr:RagB/SusD family nutrient uptake outer membrane protein [Tannerella sp.]
MKKTSIYILSLIIIALQSCRLESEMYDAINPTLFPKTAEDAEALVTGSCYRIFRADDWSEPYTMGSNGLHVVNDLASDVGECQWRDREPLLYGRWIINNGYINASWQWAKFINIMALNMDRISQIDMDETHKNRLIAELRCGRGYLGFLLYDFYGPVPIADLETLKNPLEEVIVPRATEEEMQTFIETELTEAAKALPYSYKKGDPDYGRFSKGVCYMVLLKFYMQTKQWAKAEAAGRELMKPEYGYALVSRYADIFTLENEKNAETIFSSNCLKGYNEQMWHAHVLPSDYPTEASVSKWNGYKIAWWFMHTFEEGDQRLETIVSEYTGVGGIQHSEELDVNSGEIQYGAVPFKYEIDATTTGIGNQIDFIVYRYADALTLLSEAIVRKGNAVTQEAVDLLNMVRTRAGLQAYTLNSFSDTRDFLDKLLLERGHELYWEGCRRQD